jgi:hypothetical protein
MRANGRRSLAWLSAPFLLTLAACTPELSLDNRRPPCATGYVPCDSTGACVLPSPPLPAAQNCPVGYTIRQGALVTVPLPGASASQIDITAQADLVATVRTPTGGGDAYLEVQAPHGTIPGDETVDGDARFVDIATKIAGVPKRHVRVVVSAITVTPSGDNAAAGTGEAPYRTFAQALNVVGAGDTIEFQNGVDIDPAGLTIPAGIILSGRDQLDVDASPDGGLPTSATSAGALPPITYIAVPLTLLGNAEFTNVLLIQRLHITAPGSHVELIGASCASGIEVEASAVGAFLSISGASSIIGSATADENPLFVSADAANVSIENGADIVGGGADLESIHMGGDKQTLVVGSLSIVQNSVGTIAIRDTGPSNKEALYGSTIYGRVDVLGANAQMDINSGVFRTGQDTVGGVVFQGSSMTVTGAYFYSQGIVQNSPTSMVKVRYTTFSGYLDQGYHLLAGYADLGSASDMGNDTFTSPMVGGASVPTALVIDAPAQPNNGMSVSAGTFDAPPPPAPCEFRGPNAKAPGLYSILNDVPLDFY